MIKGSHHSEEAKQKMSISCRARVDARPKRIVPTIYEKRCKLCGQTKPVKEFGRHKETADRYRTYCKPCRSRREGHIPLAEAKTSTSYLGIYVAERALSRFFDHIERMPNGNPGYDFICGKHKKIDVKSSTRRVREGRTDGWLFHIGHNTIADYFLCLAFDNREDLNPEHVWLIPGIIVSNRINFCISETDARLEEFSRFERPLGKVISCCSSMKNKASMTGGKEAFGRYEDGKP